jgi:holo-[acyl-carrier protein] synthase
MILGVGNDVLEVSRMKREMERPDHGFADAVFTPGELGYCRAKHDPAQHLAARFAAKEALLKALGTGYAGGLSLGEIEVARDDGGSPRLLLSGKVREAAARLGVTSTFVSLSHTRELATAVVVLWGDPPREVH